MDDDDARDNVFDADDFDDVEDSGSGGDSGSDDGTDDEETDDEGTGASSASSSATSESDEEISLASAIENHELPLDQIRARIENNPELLRQRDELGCLPLHVAFSDGIRETSYVLGLVRYFLQKWPESAREYTMETDEGGIERCLPLHLACEYYCLALHGTGPGIHIQRGAQDKAEMIRILVEAYPGAVREKRHDGKLPLDLALEHLPSLGSVQAIVRAWPEAIEESYRNGTLLLHEAVDHGAAEDVLQYLIEQRPASLREVDENVRIALHRQGKETRIGAVRFLVNQWEDSVKAKDEQGRIPLHYAAADWSQEIEPNIDCIDIEKCPKSALAKDDKGKIPLHIAAACWGDPELDNRGFLPLHCAASEWGGVDKARCLVEHWPDSIREKTNEGWLPLHEATHAGSLPLVKYLCETWPDAVNEPSISGWLPLHSALSCNRAVQSTLALAVYLVGHNPDMLSRATAEGYLPPHVALGRDNCQGSYGDGLREASLNLASPTLPSALELIRYLVQGAPATLRAASNVVQFPLPCARIGGCDRSERRPSNSMPPHRTEGYRPLHMAVARTHPSLEIVRFFVGQDPGCVEDADAAGSLPAGPRTNVDLELVRVLVEARPMTLLTADATGSLPLHVALQQQDVDVELVRYLVEQQPRALQHKNSRGLLPMHVAAGAAAATTVADEPPDVLFLLASMWPQAVFGERGGVAADVDATSPQQPRQRPSKYYIRSRERISQRHLRTLVA